MSALFSWFEWSLFLLITWACKVSILNTRSALKLLGWILETFNVILISTLLTSLLVFVNILGIKALIVMTVPVTCTILVTGWSRLYKGFPILVLACWEVCALMSHQIDLSPQGSLAICLMCLVVILELSIFYASCLTLLVGNLSRSMLLSLIVLETNSSSFKKKKDVSVKDLGCFWGVLSQNNLDLYCIVPFINWLVSLPEVCKQVKSRPHFIYLGPFKTLHFFPKWYQSLNLLWTSSKEHSGPCQNHHSMWSLSCIASFLVTWQAHTPESSHTSSTI